MSVRTLYGGSAPGGPFMGPALVKRGYETVRNGRAADIAPGPGECAVCISAGSPERFSKWLIGEPADVAADIRHRAWQSGLWPSEAAALSVLAVKVDRLAGGPEGPMARLANALGVSIEKLAEAIHVAQVELAVRGDSADGGKMA